MKPELLYLSGPRIALQSSFACLPLSHLSMVDLYFVPLKQPHVLADLPLDIGSPQLAFQGNILENVF